MKSRIPNGASSVVLKSFLVAAAVALGPTAPLSAQDAAVKAMQEYEMLSDHVAGIILPQQIDQVVFASAFWVDARDAGQFEKASIPGAA